MSKKDEFIITDLDDSDLTELLSNPVHKTSIHKRIKQDYAPSKKKSYRRPRRLPRKNTRRKQTRSA